MDQFCCRGDINARSLAADRCPSTTGPEGADAFAAQTQDIFRNGLRGGQRRISRMRFSTRDTLAPPQIASVALA